MPELPDVTLYVEALEARILGDPLEGARLASPFLLRTVAPPLDSLLGLRVEGVRRLGKRIVMAFPGPRFLVLHLMIAGRLRWKPPRTAIPGRLGLAAFDFPRGTLLVTEAGTRKRAALHVLEGPSSLERLDRGGVEPLADAPEALTAALRRENHTLKRALTDPRLVSGIGNAYSDEILHRARLSPLKLTGRLTDAESARLAASAREVLREWTDRLRAEAGSRFPEKVTAFREGMAVHGRYRKPCPVCGAPVQRIVYAENECNYCPGCQTGGRVLADRSLSRLLGKDWPRSLDAWEDRFPGGGSSGE